MDKEVYNGQLRKRKWGILGHKYTFVKVGHICEVGILGHKCTFVKWGTLGHKYTFVKVGPIKEIGHEHR